MDNLNFSFYTFTDPNYYDTPDRFRGTDRYRDHLRSLLPEAWTLARFDTWLRASPTADPEMQEQGFKIHVSAKFGEAEQVLDRVVPVLVDAGMTFKIAASSDMHRFMSSKRYGRGGSGKFITIYPPADQFEDLIRDLAEATRGLEGPYVLSDKRFGEKGIVFYRYGGFKLMQQLAPDGVHVATIRNGDGELIEDVRQPYFDLPDWVADPFPGTEVEPGEDDGLLNGRYAVEEALGFTNTGGVYRAVDQDTGDTVVIKEARPHTVAWMGWGMTVDAMTAIHREYDNLRRVTGVSGIPGALDFFHEWEHAFLVTEFFDGVPMTNFRASDQFIVMTFLDDRERVRGFCEQWLGLARRLLEILDTAHEKGLIIGDISPGNVLVNEDTLEIAVIDLEGAQPIDGDPDLASFSVQWFNPGFRHPERRQLEKLEPFDDWYGCGMLLYSLICPIQNLFECDKSHPIFRILDHFVEGGLPVEIRQTIAALLDGDRELALATMDELEENLAIVPVALGA